MATTSNQVLVTQQVNEVRAVSETPQVEVSPTPVTISYQGLVVTTLTATMGGVDVIMDQPNVTLVIEPVSHAVEVVDTETRVILVGLAAPAQSVIPIAPYLESAAAETFPKFSVLRATAAGGVEKASSDASPFVQPLGVALGAATQIGEVVRVQTRGPISDPSFSFTHAGPIYLGTDGALTQTQPGSNATAIQVGYPIDATTFYLHIHIGLPGTAQSDLLLDVDLAYDAYREVNFSEYPDEGVMVVECQFDSEQTAAGATVTELVTLQ